jgi:hypothetical protein
MSKRVKFNDYPTIHTIAKLDNKNPTFDRNYQNARQQQRSIGSSKRLAQRSLDYADEKCACYNNKCNNETHMHEKIITKDNHIIHCANASSKQCPHCNNNICELCYSEHIAECSANKQINRKRKFIDFSQTVEFNKYNKNTRNIDILHIISNKADMLNIILNNDKYKTGMMNIIYNKSDTLEIIQKN